MEPRVVLRISGSPFLHGDRSQGLCRPLGVGYPIRPRGGVDSTVPGPLRRPLDAVAARSCPGRFGIGGGDMVGGWEELAGGGGVDGGGTEGHPLDIGSGGAAEKPRALPVVTCVFW